MQPTPFRRARSRPFQLLSYAAGVPDPSGARLTRKRWVARTFSRWDQNLGMGFGATALPAAPATRGAAPIKLLPRHPRAAPADYRPARPDHLPIASPAFVLNACRPTRASSRRRSGERDRRFFMCYTCFEGLPDLSSGAADARALGPEAFAPCSALV